MPSKRTRTTSPERSRKRTKGYENESCTHRKIQNDLRSTFGEICNNNAASLRKQLLDIQKYKTSREQSEQWAQRLRFLDISDVPDLEEEEVQSERSKSFFNQSFGSRRPPDLAIPLTETHDDDGEEPYIAVSWRWVGDKTAERPGDNELRPSFWYKVQRQDEEPFDTEIPQHYVARAIRFAQAKRIDKIWIDKECIYQREGDEEQYPKDRELGVQVMDIVYGMSTFSLGLLTTSLTSQSEVDTLGSLLSKEVFMEGPDGHGTTFKPETDRLELQSVILKLLSDPRWSRAWIFQEDHCASNRMILLIPHSKSIRKGHKYRFGTMRNELQVRLADFRQSVTMFCIAYGEPHRWPVAEILSKAKQYNIWNREQYKVYDTVPKQVKPWRHWQDMLHDEGQARKNDAWGYTLASMYPSSTLSIFEDVCSRNLLNEEDRIAITANAARYAIRLDTSPTSPLITSRYGLSTVILALMLLNGEILKGRHSLSTQNRANATLGYTLEEYLVECQLKLNAPDLKFEQSFVDHCRFKPPTLIPRGAKTQGFLFKFVPLHAKGRMDPLKLVKRDHEKLYRYRQQRSWTSKHQHRKLNPFAEKVLDILIAKIKKKHGARCSLTNFIRRHIELDRKPLPEGQSSISTEYAIDQLSALVQAILDDRQLRLARLHDEDDDAPPSAIFISPPDCKVGWTAEHDETGERGIFTSWDNGGRLGGEERLCSIEVDVVSTEHIDSTDDATTNEDKKLKVLRTRRWLNGVWDVRSKRMESFVFPVPGILEPSMKRSDLENANLEDVDDGGEVLDGV